MGKDTEYLVAYKAAPHMHGLRENEYRIFPLEELLIFKDAVAATEHYDIEHKRSTYKDFKLIPCTRVEIEEIAQREKLQKEKRSKRIEEIDIELHRLNKTKQSLKVEKQSLEDEEE